MTPPQKKLRFLGLEGIRRWMGQTRRAMGGGRHHRRVFPAKLDLQNAYWSIELLKRGVCGGGEVGKAIPIFQAVVWMEL